MREERGRRGACAHKGAASQALHCRAICINNVHWRTCHWRTHILIYCAATLNAVRTGSGKMLLNYQRAASIWWIFLCWFECMCVCGSFDYILCNIFRPRGEHSMRRSGAGAVGKFVTCVTSLRRTDGRRGGRARVC